jgi:tRNA pseudouridine38-40 synthase
MFLTTAGKLSESLTKEIELTAGVQEGKESTAQPAEAITELESNKDTEAEVPPLQSNRVAEVEDDRNVLVSAVPVLDKTEASAESKFVFGEKEMERLNTILGKYVGTHNFHNFTARIKAEDPSAKRYILSFEACEVIEVEGMQFVRCTVLGQSFMLHQIRKMIGMAIAIMRGCAPESIIDTALRRLV